MARISRIVVPGHPHHLGYYGVSIFNWHQCKLCYFRFMARIARVAQKPLPVVYRGVQLDCGYRLDLVVEEKIIIELKAIERLLPIHEAQLLSYLRLSGVNLGLLVNFHSQMLKDGIKRLVHNFKRN